MMGSVYTILLLTDHSLNTPPLLSSLYIYIYRERERRSFICSYIPLDSSLYILSREAHQPLMAPRSGKKSIIDQIIDAAFVGNIRRIKKLAREMDEGKGMSETMGSIKDSAGRTVLHTAAMMGKINVCKYWLEELKLPVDERDDEEVTPLFHAILQGHPSTVAYLIENGADPAALTRHNVNALHVALMKGSGNVELFSFLLSKGLDVNASSDMGTPLQWAAQQCRHDLLKVLLDHGANPNISINLLPSPLMWTLLKKSLPCTKLLIQTGADPNGVSSGKTPLMCAVKTGEDKLIKCLLNAGADPNVTDDTGLKAIEIAAYDGIHRAVRILLPVTSRIPACSDWSISGIMKYVHSEEAKEQERIRERERILEEKSNGDDALKRKEYMEAMMHYTKAMALGHSDADAAAFSNRSLCMACLGYPDLALSDAEVCIKLRPDWSEGYCRAGVALYLLEKFNMAADVLLLGLKLDPQNKELKDAFRKVVEAKMNSVHI